MSFNCGLCGRQVHLGKLTELPCNCLFCTDCSRSEVEDQLRRQRCNLSAMEDLPLQQRQKQQQQQRGGPTRFDLGETVLYLTRDRVYMEAVVEIIDITVQPPQYGIQLPGCDDLRFTEEHRLCSTKPGASSSGRHANFPVAAQSLSANCPRCCTSISLPYLRRLVPDAVEAWDTDRTSAWLQQHGIIACPHAGCGALIQRLPASANAGRTSGAGVAAAAAASPGWGRRPESAAAMAAAAAHRELHRYRCGACRHDFCDSCLAAPYHNGLTCRQAQALDCMLCGGKVDEDRLEELLPAAAAAVAENTAGAQWNGGTGGAGKGGGNASKDAAAAALSVVQRATRAELLKAMKKLELDIVWCLERRDLEKAFLYWGCRTCSSPECAARRRGMCGRPLPCGHWCCGLRGEGEATTSSSGSLGLTHPRCVECGCDPRVSSAPEATASALVAECCFCWEPLPTAPCIEMACAARHVCHLHCAIARLAAGYPGPHISFTHLYCPLCRGGGAQGNAATTSVEAGGSLNPGGSSSLQAALAPVHLDHPALRAQLEPHLTLRAEVVAAVRARLKIDPSLRCDPELRPGGRYDGRPVDYGLERLTFYKCSKCRKAYYGGLRACGAGADAAQGERQQQQQGAAAGDIGDQALMCGQCCALASGTNCYRHGTSYIEWKCKYCCSLASWFCFGTTHMCEPCHSGVATGRINATMLPKRGPTDACKDPKCGLKGTPHPPPGNEACLGCGMCRAGL